MDRKVAIMKKRFLDPHLAFFILALIVSIPAYFINLDKLPFIDDESIRALVAYEMIQKSDYITPTVGGEIYMKKPPLYNWIVAASFRIFNQFGELPVRIPMVISLYMLVFAIYIFYKRELKTELAVMSALMFLTCGRIIIYETLYGLIDLSFSFLTFLFFMLVYEAFHEGKLFKLFIIAYVLTAFSFLLKGFPSIVFLGITLLVLFGFNRKLKLLFSWKHIAGILVFILIVGTYYLLYFTRNHVNPAEMLDVMIGETTRRTAIRFGIWNTLFHFLVFPFEMVYHFLPWTLLFVFLINRGVYREIGKHPFLKYLVLIFIFNIMVYWTSPEVYPRYILMLIPLIFGIAGYFYMKLRDEGKAIARYIEWIFGIILSLATLGALIPLFMELPGVRHAGTIAAFSFLIMSLLTYLFWKVARFRIYWLVLAMLVFRIGFDLVVIPVRLAESNEVEGKQMALEIASMTAGSPIYYWWEPGRIPDEYYGRRQTTYRFTFYLSVARDEIITTISEVDLNAYYIAPYGYVKEKDIDVIKIFQPAGHESPLALFQFK